MRKGNIGSLRWWNGWMLELPFELVSPFPSYSRHFSFLSWSSFFGRQLASSRYEEILFHHIRAIFSFGSLKLPALPAHKHITHQMDKFNSSLDYFRASETLITCCLRKIFLVCTFEARRKCRRVFKQKRSEPQWKVNICEYMSHSCKVKNALFMKFWWNSHLKGDIFVMHSLDAFRGHVFDEVIIKVEGPLRVSSTCPPCARRS